MSHFSVAVFLKENSKEALRKALAPYQENNMEDCPKEFLEFIECSEEDINNYENHKDEAVKLHAERIDATEEYVSAYMLDEEHYFVSVDPLKNSVERAWDILDKTGFLDEKAKDIDINDHINTTLYEEALKEATEKYGDEDPDFYKEMQTFFEQNNK